MLADDLKLLVGLGNPGDEYNKTLFKELSHSLDKLPRTKDTKQIDKYKKELLEA